jgi:hypothetical protein
MRYRISNMPNALYSDDFWRGYEDAKCRRVYSPPWANGYQARSDYFDGYTAERHLRHSHEGVGTIRFRYRGEAYTPDTLFH